MKVYTQYNSYYDSEFDENRIWSCHSWIFNCIDNIAETFHIIDKNQSYIHNKDLVGKYNSLNYLLDIFAFHQTSGFRRYPKNRNVELDFCIILYGLLTYGAQMDSIDYERKTFMDNFDNMFQSQQDLSWKQKYKLFSNESKQLVYQRNDRKSILKSMLANEKRPVYIGLFLEFSLDINNNQTKKFKL
jgi:hypothetical protein